MNIINNRILVYYVLLFLVTYPFGIFAQNAIDKSVKIDGNGRISFIDFTECKDIINSPNDFFYDILKIRPQEKFLCQDNNMRKSKGKYAVYQQYYDGIIVEDGEYTFHYLKGNLVYAHGHYIPVDNLKTTPTISVEDVKKIISKYTNAPLDSIQLLDIKLVIKNISNAPKNTSLLVYKACFLDTYNKKALLWYIDAHAGEIVYTHPLAVNISCVGTFQTLYNGIKQGTTKYDNSAYHLYDSTRNIHTWNLEGGYFNSQKYDLYDDDNNWTTAEHHSNNNDMALDVHWTLQQIYDRLKNHHNIYSFDNDNHPIVAHIKYFEKDNACWFPISQSLYFGEGQNTFNPLASIDVIAHEFGHGITQSNIGWSGDIEDSFNEGMSDIWGAIFEHAINPNSTSIWSIGEGVVKNHACLRNLKNTYSSDALSGIANTCGHYLSQNDIYEVGGVLSHWFYLLVNGGKGTNENGDWYIVYPVGFDLAEDLIIEAVFNNHLRNTSSFEEIRTAFYQAANTLGEYYLAQQVLNAWFAVGVGNRPTQISILGNNHICDSQVFSVNNITSDVGVTWDFLNSSSLNLLQINIPTANQCTFINPNNYYINDSIVATISKNGQQLAILKQYVYAHFPFYGTYSQTLRPINKYGYYAIPETNFTDDDNIIVNPDCYIFIESSKFKNMTMSCIPHNYSTASINRIDEETIRLYVNYEPRVRYGSVTIYGSSPEGCDDFSFTVYVTANRDLFIPLQTISSDISNGQLLLSINFDDAVYSEDQKDSDSDLSGWIISIIECTTGQCVYSNEFQNERLRIDTSKWKKGVYLIQAQNGKQNINKKIVI